VAAMWSTLSDLVRFFLGETETFLEEALEPGLELGLEDTV